LSRASILQRASAFCLFSQYTVSYSHYREVLAFKPYQFRLSNHSFENPKRTQCRYSQETSRVLLARKQHHEDRRYDAAVRRCSRVGSSLFATFKIRITSNAMNERTSRTRSPKVELAVYLHPAGRVHEEYFCDSAQTTNRQGNMTKPTLVSFASLSAISGTL
jgi:hypothetical protein